MAVNRALRCFLISSLYTLLYFFQPETESGLKGSVLEAPVHCFSPHVVIRKLSFLPVILSPLFAPNLPVLFLHLVGIGTLGLLQFETIRNLQGQCHLVVLSHFTRILIALVQELCLTIMPRKSFLPSHFSHDCSSGLAVLLIPASVWTLDNTKRRDKGLQYTFGTATILLINIIEIRIWRGNGLANIVSALVTILLITFLPRSRAQDLPQATEIHLATVAVKSSRRDRDKVGSLRVFWIGLILLVLAYCCNFEQIGGKSEEMRSFAIAISTAPRHGTPIYLLQTLDTFLEEMDLRDRSSKNHNINVTIYVISYSDSLDLVFNSTQYLYSNRKSSHASVKFSSGSKALALVNYTLNSVRATDQKRRLNYDFAASLMFAYTSSPEAEFIMLHEDDFVLCPDKWDWIRDAITLSARRNDCGLFLGTGGAGLVIKRKAVLQVVATLLDEEIREPADVKVQKCLQGLYPNHCKLCAESSLLVASHLVFGHIGFISSMNHEYLKWQRKWDCDWRHAFSDHPLATIIHTDRNVFI